MSSAAKEIAHIAVALVLAGTVLAGPADARQPKPRIPPGRDPGGIAVAMVGRGLDFARAGFLQRLARDGEGEAIAWDLVDNLPAPLAPAGGGDDALAGIVLDEGQATRLVVVRTPARRPEMLAQALLFVARTPARIVLLVPEAEGPIATERLADAARRLPNLLLVVPARLAAPPAAPLPAEDRAGLIVVAAEASAVAPGAVPAADVAISLEPRRGGATELAVASGEHADDIAAARVAALAARVLAVAPELAGASLRARILSFAKPRSDGPPLIAGIWRIHWLE
jgi:hypothetical protein